MVRERFFEFSWVFIFMKIFNHGWHKKSKVFQIDCSGFRVPLNCRVLDWEAWPIFLGSGSSGLLDLVQGYLHTRSIGSGTYCLSLVHNILPMDLVHSSRWTRSLFYTSLELPIWADHIPACLGNSFTCVQYKMCYTYPGPFFWCEFNCDVNLVIRLPKFRNFGNLVHMYMHSAPILNVDPAAMSISN